MLTVHKYNSVFVEPHVCESIEQVTKFFWDEICRPEMVRSSGTGCSPSGNNLDTSCLRQEKASIWTLINGSTMETVVRRITAMQCELSRAEKSRGKGREEVSSRAREWCFHRK